MSRVTKRLQGVRLTEAEQAEVDRFNKLAQQSRNDGHRLDEWAYHESAMDIIEKAAGIKRCGSCHRILP